MAALRNSSQANQATCEHAREEPKLTLPSGAEHAKGHERKSNCGMSTDK
jgi:hypothetical protein